MRAFFVSTLDSSFSFSISRSVIYLWLAAGGVLGTLARFGLSGWVTSGLAGGVPWGTLVANLLGSFLLGVVIRGAEAVTLAPELRAFLTVGFCGALTTFSTLSFETVALLQQGAYARAGGYALGSLLLGLLAVVAGFATAALLMTPRS